MAFYMNNKHDYEGIEVLLRRDEDHASGRNGWYVHIQPDKTWKQLPFGKEDLDFLNLKNIWILHQDCHIKIHCLHRAWSYEEAEKIKEIIEDWILMQSKKKRLRQVRNALNKCKDKEKIEKIAKILGV